MQSLFCDQIQPQINQIQPYIPGKPISELQREFNLIRISKLASNENPLGASPKALKAVQDELINIARYPDGSAFYLKTELAEFLGKSPDQISIGNGSNELLELVARIFAGPGDEVIFSEHAFAVYPISTQAVGATAVEIPAVDWAHDLPAIAAAITDKTKLIYLANPNNPTGTLFLKEQWEAFMRQVPQSVVVVLDEAYFEYVSHQHYANGLDYLDDYPNLLVSRTFSKAYGLASMRIGYMAGCEEITSYIERLREPFNVNHYAQVAAIAALKDQSFVKKSVQTNEQGMAQLQQFLQTHQLDYIPSHGNFVCVGFGETTMQVNDELLKNGVIVRPVANYKMPNYLRVSIGTPKENQHFIDAVSKILNENR